MVSYCVIGIVGEVDKIVDQPQSCRLMYDMGKWDTCVRWSRG